MSDAEGEILARVEAIKEKFQQAFNTEADYVVRAPGRVNIIGEHIDYCGYGVFPMAVQQDILAAVRRHTSKKIILKNVESKYPDFSCDADDFTIDSSSPKWFDYFLCGVKAIEEQFPDHPTPGMDILVEGTLPPAAGMSSSSALVVAAALATLQAVGKTMEREELASLCAKCERYIGVQGGGMDQAICLLAEKNSAKLIEFEPRLSSTTVRLPEEAVFVVANSCVEINKGNTSHYNIRVVECRLAAQVILKEKGFDWEKPVRLCEVQKALGLRLDEMATIVRDLVHEKPYTIEELCTIFGKNEQEFCKWALTEKTNQLRSFNLYGRAMHVFQEAERVYKFKDACESGDLESMGNLMRKSHNSCRDLYDCSHPHLDKIVSLVLEEGALGSRLTGAGWGGCSVTLTTADKVNAIVERLRDSFCAPRGLNIEGNVFISSPAERARVFDILD